MTWILFQTQTQEPLQDNHMVTFVLKGSSQAVVWDQGTNSIFYVVSSNAEWIRACIRVEFLTSDLIVFLESLPRLTKEHFSHQVFLRVFFHLQLEESRADAIMQPVTVQDPWGQCNHYTLYMKQICFRPCLSSILKCVPAAPFLSWTISTC